MPHQLDDLGFVTRLDPQGMYRYTVEFPQQCRRALEIARSTEIPELENRPNVAMLTGLGGSAAGGDLVRALFEAEGQTPFIVNRDYTLPNYIGLGDLVFCASYSGNTEETLSAYDNAHKAGARVISVTSGGKLAAMSEISNHPVIRIPGGQPPRTALGYMFVPVLATCERLGLLPQHDHMATYDLLERCAGKWGVETPFEQNQAKRIAQELHGSVALLYGLGFYQGLVANRWRGQINENAKNLAFPYQFPELNHNEILGWVKANEQNVKRWLVLVLEDGTESEKMKARARVTEQLLKDIAQFYYVKAEGATLLERMLSLTYFGDFLSLYLAALNGVDPENIDWINVLKAELGKVS